VTQLQLDLFGEMSRAERARLEAAEREAAEQAEQAEWEARFERAVWVAPADCGGGMKKGDTVLGWRCPACKDVEPTEFALGNNHGYHLYDRHVPFRAEFGATCFKLNLQENHAIYDARMAMIRHLIDVGWDDEAIAGRVGFWPASMIARDRKAYAKAVKAGDAVRHGSGCPCAGCGGSCTCSSCDPDPQGVLFGVCWECDYDQHVCSRCGQPVEHGRAWHETCPACPVCDGTGLRKGDFWVNNRRVQLYCDCPAGKALAAGKVPG